jgi:putative transposase
MPRSRYHIAGGQSPHFMTATIVLYSWRYLQREAGFTLYGYFILGNHLHLIAAS